MIRTVGYQWHLRAVMAARGMFATTELGPLLAERGVIPSREQVYRLVVNTPERLNLTTLAALCDILAVTPADLAAAIDALRSEIVEACELEVERYEFAGPPGDTSRVVEQPFARLAAELRKPKEEP